MTALLHVADLTVDLPVRSAVLRRRVGVIHALRGITFRVDAGETLAMVGESGSGKTTAARAITRLVPTTRGRVEFDGQSVLEASGEALRRIRRNLQIVFQDPYSSLNRRMRIGEIVGEPLYVHRVGDVVTRRRRVADLLTQVGLGRDAVDRFPAAFSGGQRQRIAIARALALSPQLIVCDEPISALDVSVQAQILNLLQELKRRYNLSYLFITHDLAVVRRFADRVAVMHAGHIVELAPAEKLFVGPLHPYTRALLSAAPRLRRNRTETTRIRLSAPPPSPLSTPTGCLFAQRCGHALDRCRQQAPVLREHPGGQLVACHLAVQGRSVWDLSPAPEQAHQ